MQEAVLCGTAIARAGLTLVYGGGKTGLMGAVADAALAAGGRVLGVMPEDLVNAEIAHRGLTELHVVQSMHERKLKMADLSDAFLCLPGGPGTFEEIFEQWTWALLGIHAKPCGFVNTSGYYDLMAQTIQKMADLSDAFLCLPGGPGTFEEIFEQWTWALLGIHAKPCGFVNTSGYYDLMAQTIQKMADSGFIAQQYVDMLIYADATEPALEAFRSYVAPPPKWSNAKPRP
jgi:uncharacterized protein (TIGR00730 family)